MLPVVLLTRESLDPAALEAQARTDSAGAVVGFIGFTRDNHQGRPVKFLEYEAQETLALRALHSLREQALKKFGVSEAIIHHRLGKVEVGHASVVIAVAGAHRGEAFDACRHIIDTLKTTVPIWKKEYYGDGSEPVWVGPDGKPIGATGEAHA